MQFEVVIFVFSLLWVLFLLLCLLNAYLPDPSVKHSPRAKARLILTGWFFPVAAPIWLSVFLWRAVKGIVLYFWDAFRLAFSREA